MIQMYKKLPIYVLTLLTFSIVFSACKKEYEDIYTTDDRKIQEFISKNGFTMTKDPSGFYYQVLSAGSGGVITDKDSVFYSFDYSSLAGNVYFQTGTYSNSGNYLGYLTNSYNKNYPGEVFRTAISKVQRGGRIRIVIPSYMAFGKNGANGIPPNEVLTGVVNVFTDLRQSDIDEKRIADFISAKGITNAIRQSSGIYIVTNTPGNGTEAILSYSTVEVKYTGRLLDGTVFDQTGDISYNSELSRFIKGWKKGLIGLSAGSKVRLLIPSGLAYSDEVKGAIPANSVLDFDVEIVKVTNP